MDELNRLRAENKALRELLAEYVAEDNTYEGGHWEEHNAPWLGRLRAARALLIGDTCTKELGDETIEKFND